MEDESWILDTLYEIEIFRLFSRQSQAFSNKISRKSFIFQNKKEAYVFSRVDTPLYTGIYVPGTAEYFRYSIPVYTVYTLRRRYVPGT